MSATLHTTHTGDNWGAAVTIPAVTTAGRTLIASVQATGSNTNNTTVTDTAGNTWTRIANTEDVGATSQRLGQLWYCGNANAITSITVTAPASQNVTVVLSEWTGITGFRGFAVQNFPASTVTTAAVAGDVVFSSCFYNQDTAEPPTDPISPPAGWTTAGARQRLASMYNSAAYQNVATAGSVGPHWVIGTTRKAVITAAFTTTSSSSGGATSNAYVRVGGAWRPAEPHVRVGGTWKRADGEPV